jgi:hypothetical protein
LIKPDRAGQQIRERLNQVRPHISTLARHSGYRSLFFCYDKIIQKKGAIQNFLIQALLLK